MEVNEPAKWLRREEICFGQRELDMQIHGKCSGNVLGVSRNFSEASMAEEEWVQEEWVR